MQTALRTRLIEPNPYQGNSYFPEANADALKAPDRWSACCDGQSHTQGQIALALKQVERGVVIEEVRWKMSFSDVTFYAQRKKHGEQGPSRSRHLNWLAEGNRSHKARHLRELRRCIFIDFYTRFRARQFLAKMAASRLRLTSAFIIKIGYLKLRAILVANPFRRPPHARPCCPADRVKIARPPLGCTPQNFRRENIFRRETKLSNAILDLAQDGFRSNPSLLDKPRFDLRFVLQVLSIRFHAARPQLPRSQVIETGRHRHVFTRLHANTTGQC